MPILLREQPHPIQPLRDSQPRVRFPPREDSAVQSVTRAMTWEAQRKSVPDRGNSTYKDLEARSSTGENKVWQEGRQ